MRPGTWWRGKYWACTWRTKIGKAARMLLFQLPLLFQLMAIAAEAQAAAEDAVKPFDCCDLRCDSS